MSSEPSELLRKEILPFLPANLKTLLLNVDDRHYADIEEVRLRNGKPLGLRIGDEEFTIDRWGHLNKDLWQGYVVSGEDIYRSIASISDNSLYAFEEEISRGYITIPGGHRVGLAGQAVMSGSRIRTIKNFSGINFRIAREVWGCADKIGKFICAGDTIPGNTLLISPPRCGKTTILRDLARSLSQGNTGRCGCNVVIVDERSELAGTFQGQAQLDIGPRTDVLDACPKAAGMMMAIRSLGPQVIVTDEIGRPEDIDAIRDCVNAGVGVITSIHGRDANEIQRRPLICELMMSQAFANLIVLSRRHGPGTVENMIRWEA